MSGATPSWGAQTKLLRYVEIPHVTIFSWKNQKIETIERAYEELLGRKCAGANIERQGEENQILKFSLGDMMGICQNMQKNNRCIPMLWFQ